MVLLTLALVGLLYILAVNRHIVREGSKFVVQPENAPQADAILILGARVFPDGASP
jgi:hypothetical protein